MASVNVRLQAPGDRFPTFNNSRHLKKHRMGNSMEVPRDTKNRAAMKPLSRVFTQRQGNRHLKEMPALPCSCSITHDSQGKETAHQEVTVGTQGILASQEAGGPAICNIRDEPGGYCAQMCCTQKENICLVSLICGTLKSQIQRTVAARGKEVKAIGR